jgi:hypothetical protein
MAFARRGLSLAVLLALCVSASIVRGDTARGESANDRMFARLCGLAGHWEGRFEWSAGRTGSGPLEATYYLTGNGSALVENLILRGEPSMTSVYHRDGSDIRMTHYSAAKNQPRFKAKRIDEASGAIEFAFVDVTNARKTKPAYVVAASLRIISADEIHIRFTLGGSPGVRGVENISLRRSNGPVDPVGKTGEGQG